MDNMSVDEIVRSYLQAEKKTEQIFILADLTASDSETILEILRDEGAIKPGDLRTRICCRCDKEYVTPVRRGVPICPDCRGISVQIHQLEYELKCIAAKMQDKTREIGTLKNEGERLRLKIKCLKEKLGGTDEK